MMTPTERGLKSSELKKKGSFVDDDDDDDDDNDNDNDNDNESIFLLPIVSYANLRTNGHTEE